MSGFQAVNTTLSVPDLSQRRAGGDTTPTTPRPNTKFFPESKPSEDPRADDSTAKTPTRNSFGGGLAGQRPLPSEPFTPGHEISQTPGRNSTLSRGNSHRSTQSVESQDVEMGDDDEAREGGSDNESVNSDTNRPAKKKKGQRFFCTEFPPCQLSFTRSEHLARHIRKHTGERPFQCHCSRRFSRLDNLRQHAQTVHVNEDIPGDSLAATGTRFQRQIRTEKMRPPGRSRANTLGSQGGHSRGHSRNLSTSSITSTASSISVSQAPDVRRRPPPLAMANDATARARLSLNTLDSYNPPLMGSPGPQIVEYNGQSTGVTTPTSATFSTGTGSPGRFASGLQSPSSTASRPATWGARTPGRRLSVPSGGNPFQASPGATFSPSNLAPLPSSTSSTFSTQSSVFGSPTTSNFSESRRESLSEMDVRRRTWHPGTYTGFGPRPATSGLAYYQTLDAPRPSFTSQPAASQTTRLPGIESFDHAPPPLTLPRRQPSPMQIDPQPQRPLTYHAPVEPSLINHEKRTSISWDTTLQKDINRLHIASPNPPSREWLSNLAQGPQPPPMSASRPTTAPHSGFVNQQPNGNVPPPIQVPPRNPDRLSQEQPMTPRKNKRHGWYNGPLPLTQQLQPQPGRTVQRTSPEDSSSSEGVPTPSNSSMTEYHPAIVHSNGYIEQHPPGVPPPVEEHKPGPAPPSVIDRNPAPYHQQPYQSHNQQLPPSGSGYRTEVLPPVQSIRERQLGFGESLPGHNHPAGDMRRLEALVAVATGEQRAVGGRP